MCTYLIIPYLLKGVRETAQLVKCFLNKDLSFIPIIHIKNQAMVAHTFNLSTRREQQEDP